MSVDDDDFGLDETRCASDRRRVLAALAFFIATTVVAEAAAQEQRGPDWRNAELVFDTAGWVKLRDGKSGGLCIAPSDGDMACGQDLVARNPTAEAHGGVELQRVVAGDLVPSLPGDEFVLEFSGNTTGGNYTGTIYLIYRLDGEHRPVKMAELQFDKYTGQTVTEARVVRGRLEVKGLRYKDDDPGCCPSMGFEETYNISPKKGGFVVRKGANKTWRLPTEGDATDGPDDDASDGFRGEGTGGGGDQGLGRIHGLGRIDTGGGQGVKASLDPKRRSDALERQKERRADEARERSEEAARKRERERQQKTWKPRAARALAACRLYSAEVLRRRAEMRRLQEIGSPKLPDVMERNNEWLEQQQEGAFGRALGELQAIMSEMEDAADEGDGGDVTFKQRVWLAREAERHCQP